MCGVEADDRERFEALVGVLKEELSAQFAVRRAHDTDDEVRVFAVLLADAVWDSFAVAPRA